MGKFNSRKGFGSVLVFITVLCIAFEIPSQEAVSQCATDTETESGCTLREECVEHGSCNYNMIPMDYIVGCTGSAGTGMCCETVPKLLHCLFTEC